MKSNKSMPKVAFEIMTGIFKIRDFFKDPSTKLNNFNIKAGDTVVDYGCGPGRYVKRAAAMVGEKGKVYAIDIHESAIKHVDNLINKYNLENVTPVLIKSGQTAIEENSADVVFALDMFHHVSDAKTFLQDIHRITKKDGRFYLEDGHQARSASLMKIQQSDLWKVEELRKSVIILKPV